MWLWWASICFNEFINHLIIYIFYTHNWVKVPKYDHLRGKNPSHIRAGDHLQSLHISTTFTIYWQVMIFGHYFVTHIFDPRFYHIPYVLHKINTAHFYLDTFKCKTSWNYILTNIVSKTRDMSLRVKFVFIRHLQILEGD